MKKVLLFTDIVRCFHGVGCRPSQRVEKLAIQMLLSEIDTRLRVAHFIGQICHESNFLQSISENLNYSAEGLLRVFPRYFTRTTALSYQRQPEKIANRVYADRMGNGDEISGDGWKFRGRTEIQLTGRWNYSRYSQKLFGDDRLVHSPDTAEVPEISSAIVCLFWTDNKCNVLADEDDIRKLTRTINGGYNGLDHREQLYKRALAVL